VSRQAQWGEESSEGVEERSSGSLLADHNTRSYAGQVDAASLQDVCVAPKLLAALVQHSVGHVGIANYTHTTMSA